MDIDLLRVIADWTGWAPIAIVLFVVVFGVIFVYSREVSNKDETIRRLSIELENSKQYTPSLLIQNLGQHVKEYEQEIGRLNERLRILNDEVETETRKKSVEKVTKKAETQFNKQVERTLHRFNIPSRNEITTLSAKITRLSKKVEELNKAAA
ncbi:MAG: phasin family protein [Anaerolineales bacterium]|nr:phasin family protein [Anaerolineales bacterium]